VCLTFVKGERTEEKKGKSCDGSSSGLRPGAADKGKANKAPILSVKGAGGRKWEVRHHVPIRQWPNVCPEVLRGCFLYRSSAKKGERWREKEAKRDRGDAVSQGEEEHEDQDCHAGDLRRKNTIGGG